MDNTFSDSDYTAMLGEMEKEAKTSSFQSPYWKPEGEGTTKLRIITPLKQFGEKLFYQKQRIHYVGQQAFFCLNQSLKDKNGNVHEPEACPICAKSRQIYNNSEKGTEDWQIAGSIAAKDRYVARVIVRGNKTSDGKDCETKPEFWQFGKKIHGYFFNQIKMGEVGNFLSLKDGRDYNLVKTGTGRNTNYDGSCLSMKTSPIFDTPEKLKELLEELPKMDYSQLVEFRPASELQKAVDEMLSGASDTAAAETASPSNSVNEPDTLDPFSQPATSVKPVEEKSADSQSIDDLLSLI